MRTSETSTVHRLALLFALGAAACGSPEGTSDLSTPSTVALEPEAVIGQLEGDPDYLFGDVRSVAVDDAGRVYAGDRIGATVRVYSRAGEFLAQIAREGQGPGEIYGWPADLAFGPEGRLYVRDASRVTVFAPSGAEGVADSLAATWTYPGYGNLTFSRSRIGTDGTYYYPNGFFRIGEAPRYFYQIFRGGVPTADTMEVPAHGGLHGRRPSFYRLGPSNGRMLEGLNHVPFAPVPVWDVTDRGTVLSTGGGSDTLLETDLAGDTVRVIALLGQTPRPVPAGDRADSLRALETRIDSLPVPLDEVVNLGPNVAERRLPDVLPSVIGLQMGGPDRIWVERWPVEGRADTRVYDLFDWSGALRASISLSAPLDPEPAPFFGDNDVVGVVTDPETGVQRVLRFSLAEVLGGG